MRERCHLVENVIEMPAIDDFFLMCKRHIKCFS